MTRRKRFGRAERALAELGTRTAGPYFHGGVAGLALGALVLPPSETGNRSLQDWTPKRQRHLIRRDRVYAIRDVDQAAVFAALAPQTPGGGWIYQVELSDPVEADPDWKGPVGVSVMAPSATVVRIVARGVTLGNRRSI